MNKLCRYTLILASLWTLAMGAQAGELAIVIDDFGYRPHNERQILALPAPISVSVLPNAPHAREMAIAAHQGGHEVLIHLPMAPVSQQPLEKDTLFPDMNAAEIRRIIHEAVDKVPYAVGMNNHMGSAMTASLPGMQKVMRTLAGYQLFFLDSRTIASSKATQAAMENGVPVLKRDVFLDDVQQDEAIRQQFNRAIALARRNGSAIAIGHPHPATVRVLRQMLAELPQDIRLVAVDSLLRSGQSPLVAVKKIGTCQVTTPLPATSARQFLQILWQSARDSLIEAFRPLDKNLRKN